jgi:hypothetical protein
MRGLRSCLKSSAKTRIDNLGNRLRSGPALPKTERTHAGRQRKRLHLDSTGPRNFLRSAEIAKYDDRGCPHCEDGPALKYRDGYTYYAIHGVRCQRNTS